MASDSVTGKAGGLLVAGSGLTFTKWTAKPKKQYAKSTDSSNYDAGSGRLCSAQVAGEENLEGTIEGFWSRSQTPALIARIKSDTPVAIVLKIDQATTFASFNADLSEFAVDLAVPGAELVPFTCNFMSNGLITYP